MFTLIRIEIVAGEILNLLEKQNRPLTLEEIGFYLHEPMDLLDKAIVLLEQENVVDTVALEQYCSYDESKLAADEISLCAS